MVVKNVLQLYVTGSLDQISGSYTFQGRRFDIEEAGSSINFVGDLNPLWVCVAAFGFGILEAGGLMMQAEAGVPKDAIRVIEGLIILVLAARRYFATRATAPI